MSVEILPISERTVPIEIKGMRQTNWQVVTGGPESGKTSLLDYLEAMGYKRQPEMARVLIDQELSKGRTIGQIRANEARFQARVTKMKEELEDGLPEDELMLLDRGLHGDTAAYWREAPGYSISELKRRYKGIFILDRLPWTGDYARTENDRVAERIHRNIGREYVLLGYSPIRVPLFSSNEQVSIRMRADFVIDEIRKVDPSVPKLSAPPESEVQLAFSL